MVNIYIKSFNRPYYLDRCLYSVRRFVKGDYAIVILDDGTPDNYLTNISRLYPGVTVRRSYQYEQKVQGIEDHISGARLFDRPGIPTDFWYEAINDGSPFFMLLEEDAWLTDPVELSAIIEIMKKEHLLIVKIGWNGCDGIVSGKKKSLSESIDEINPVLPLSSEFFLLPLLRNTFKIKSILLKLGVMRPSFMLPYYSLYTVTSAFFEKAYWLWLWHDAAGHVNEGYQLEKAIKWKKTRGGKYGKTLHEKLQTSFITASVNRFKNVSFDMFWLNHYFNEAWLRGDLESTHDFPHDFRVNYLKNFIPDANSHCSPERWENWIAAFKKMYRDIGCLVDN